MKGKVAVITGGSVGIGLAVAEALAKEGVHLALCARDERVEAEAEQNSGKYGVKAVGVRRRPRKKRGYRRLCDRS